MNEAELAITAQELVCRVRDYDPVDNGRWLASVTTEADRWALLFVLAAAIPDDRTWEQLTAWTDPFAKHGDGRPDTPEKVQQRRRELIEAMDERELAEHRRRIWRESKKRRRAAA